MPYYLLPRSYSEVTYFNHTESDTYFHSVNWQIGLSPAPPPATPSVQLQSQSRSISLTSRSTTMPFYLLPASYSEVTYYNHTESTTYFNAVNWHVG